MKLRQKAASLGGIPEDVLMGWPKVVLYGTQRLLVEQHRGVLSYEEKAVRIRTSLGILTVEGEGLQIIHYGPMDAVVTGKVARIFYASQAGGMGP